MRALAPAGEVLFFACAKEKYPKESTPDPRLTFSQVPSLFEKIERCLLLPHFPVLHSICTSSTSLARKHLYMDVLISRRPGMAESGLLAMISIFSAQLSLANGIFIRGSIMMLGFPLAPASLVLLDTNGLLSFFNCGTRLRLRGI